MSARLTPTLIKRLYRRADVVTANSRANLQALERLVGFGPSFRFLPNPVPRPSEMGAPVWDGLAGSHPRGLKILAAGRLTYQKGIDVLLRALALLGPKCPFDAVIVGDGVERRALEALADRLGIADAVHFAGSQVDPFPYYRWADVTIAPSRYEGFPNVPLESMFVRTTVICTDCPTGPRELSDNGRFARLVPVDDVKALSTAIRDLVTDKASAAHAEAAREWVTNRHSDAVQVAALEDIAVEALSRSRGNAVNLR